MQKNSNKKIFNHLKAVVKVYTKTHFFSCFCHNQSKMLQFSLWTTAEDALMQLHSLVTRTQNVFVIKHKMNNIQSWPHAVYNLLNSQKTWIIPKIIIKTRSSTLIIIFIKCKYKRKTFSWGVDYRKKVMVVFLSKKNTCASWSNHKPKHQTLLTKTLLVQLHFNNRTSFQIKYI